MRRLVAKSAVAVMAAVMVVLILQTPAVLGQPERPRDGQGEPGQRPPFPPEGPGREPPGGGPWNNDVLVYRVSPNGEVVQIATYERVGVPTIARMKDGRLVAAHQHFPANSDADFDKVAVRFSSMPACMGYKLTAGENPFGTGPARGF
ncbi:MAG: hypothetical protein FJ276_30260 [Planctomycetes bacterium]|nr:hypothetical protein [Planctomycetota bacterium]